MNNRKFQLNWGTTIALLVSFAALITTIYEANILKAQQEALVWPYFEIYQQFGSEGVGYKAKNSGTGPAIVTSVEAIYKGEPVGNFMDVLDDIVTDSMLNYYNFNYRSLNNTVYRPGEEKFVFFMPWSSQVREMVKNAQPITFKVEYRSVLNDYWVYDSQTKEHTQGRYRSRKEFFSSR